MTQMYRVTEWRIENLSQWCAEVHGEYIESPRASWMKQMELYPKGIGGRGENLVVRLCGIEDSCSGDLSFYLSRGSLLCKQQVDADGNEGVLELPPGPKFEDVLFNIRERNEDFITVELRRKNSEKGHYERIYTTIGVLKISLEINPRWIEEMKSDETKNIFYVQLLPRYYNLGRMWLKICSKNNAVNFTITPPTENEHRSFAVEMCLSLTGGDDDTGHSSCQRCNRFCCEKKEHVFSDGNPDPWTFPKSLEKKESVEKGISLFFCFKTQYLIESPIYMRSASYSCISIESKNKICFALTDSVEVLTKDLMCLYQDQDLSDITLKCDNVSFPVHKNILSSRSPVFKTMLSIDMAEAASSEVDIEDLDPSTLSLFLTHLYTGTVKEELLWESALKLYYAADKYQVPSLKRDCSKFLCDNVSISNVCDILSLADKHQDHELSAVSYYFILDNFNEVMRSEEWDTFKGREPLLAVNAVTRFGRNNDLVKKCFCC